MKKQRISRCFFDPLQGEDDGVHGKDTGGLAEADGSA